MFCALVMSVLNGPEERAERRVIRRSRHSRYPPQIAQSLEHLESGSAVIRGAAGVGMSKDHKEV